MFNHQQLISDATAPGNRGGVLCALLRGVRNLSMVVIFAALLMAVLPWVNAAGVDPTTPMVFGSKKPVRVTPRAPVYRLSSLLLSDQRKLAVINGRLVAEGERVSGALVRSISSAGVQLQSHKKTIFLRLPQAVIKSPASVPGSAR